METTNLYDKYYLKDERVIDMIRQGGVIVFDTSALLSLYYYSDPAKEQIFQKAFGAVADRLWIPAQVYFEFLKNKGKVSGKPQDTYNALISDGSSNRGPIPAIASLSKELKNKQVDKIKKQLQTLKEQTSDNKKHPFVDKALFTSFDAALSDLETAIDTFISETENFRTSISEEIEQQIAKLQTRSDDIQDYIEAQFRIGRELTFDEMMEICKEGKYRYEEQIPPGYKDKSNKEGMGKYGNLFIWKQILEYASSVRQDVLFISNDVKGDWWDSEYDAPRMELLKEFNSATGRVFWSCTMSEFLHLVNETGDQEQKIAESVIKEVGAISSGKAGVNTEDASLYTKVAKAWLQSQTEYTITEMLPLNQEWRVFGKLYVYRAITCQDEKSIIVLNVVTRMNYDNALHALRNAVSVKKYYDRFGKKYRYRQLVVALSERAADSFEILMNVHPKLSRFFRSENIENTLLYLDKGELIYVDSNHAMG